MRVRAIRIVVVAGLLTEVGCDSMVELPADPAISAIVPAEVARGSGPTVVRVEGRAFVPGSTVTFNGSGRPTTFESSTRLAVEISPLDLFLHGVARLRVVEPSPGGRQSSEAELVILAEAPVISTLSPADVLEGDGPMLLMVRGRGFSPTSRVEWNGTALGTQFGSDSVLTATLPAGHTAAAGSAQVRVVTSPPGGGTSASVPFTVRPRPPASLELLFWSPPIPGVWRLHVMRANGSERREIPGGWRCVGGASWSPDGARIAYSFTAEAKCFGHGGVRIAAADGSAERAITTEDSGGRYMIFDTRPEWSPDGEWITFHRSFSRLQEEAPPGGIFIVAADGSGLRRLPGLYSSPRWSPDGGRMVFAEVLSDGSPALIVANPDGTGRVRLAAAENTGAGAPAGPVWLSPALIRFYAGNGMYVVAADGSGAARVAAPSERGELSPDGEWLLYTESEGITHWVVIARSDGSMPLRVVEGTAPRWRPKP
jgi:hypothetical protein